MFAKIRDHRRKLGIAGENAVCKLLECEGMKILARNWRCRSGELDIVAFDKNILVFVEVKTAVIQHNFSPADNLSTHQKKRNYNAAKVYMRSLEYCPFPGKFDLVEVFFRRNFIVKIRKTPNYLPDLPVQLPYE